jgi:hypothetical protein
MLATGKQRQVTWSLLRRQTSFSVPEQVCWNMGFNSILTRLPTLEDLSAYISHITYKFYKMKRIYEPLLNCLQGFRQCHLISKDPCFYRNRRHGSSFPTRRVRCWVVQPMARRPPKSAGWIRQTKSSLTCHVSGEYSAYTSKEGYTDRDYINVSCDFHEDVNSSKKNMLWIYFCSLKNISHLSQILMRSWYPRVCMFDTQL